MNLILTRNAGQAIQVGTHLVTVDRVTRANANLRVGKCVHNVALHDKVILEPGVAITVLAITKGNVRLSFYAPKHIKIMRTELEDHADNS